MELKKCSMKVCRGVLAGLLLSGLLVGNAMAADAYPSKPIKIYYGYKSGGTAHTSLQPLAKGLEKILGESIVLVEKSGASATIAGGVVSKAKPDGYTLGLIKSTTITTAPHELKLPYSPSEDLVHLFAYAGPPSGFAVKADAPWNSWQEYLDYARANPGKVAWTATGSTGTQYLLMQHIGRLEGIKWNGVPAAGGSSAMKLVLGGQVSGYAASGSHISQIQSGNAKELVDFGVISTYPDVPTLQELGYEGLAVKGEPYIIVAPKGLPEDIQKTLVDAFVEAAQSEDYLKIVERLNMQPMNLQGEELQKMLSDSDELVRMLLESAGKL